MTEEKQLISKIEILNAKSIIITPSTPIHKEWLDKYHLKKIKFSTEVEIQLGDKISLEYPGASYETYYVTNFIYKEDKTRFRINEFEDNVSSTYILPLIKIKKEHLLIETTFINCYLQHYKFQHNIGEYVYLIYRYLPLPFYAKFIEILQKQNGCISYFREVDKRFDCFVFKIDESKIKDIKLILKGKYSKISDESKQLILKFHNQTNPEAPINQILYKGNLRRNELIEYFKCSSSDLDNVDFDNVPKLEEESWLN